MSNHRYLIVGGTSRAGTTSLFKYLADHPEVDGSALKETRFFLDADYPLPVRHRFASSLEPYEAYFSTRSAVRLEATPDYLHSPGTAARLATALGDPHLVFTLRDPVTRLESWFLYGQQRGELPADLGFDTYVERQLSAGEDGQRAAHVPERALVQGRYAAALEPFLQELGPGRVHVVFFEDLVADPRAVLRDVCRAVELATDPYDDYAFRRHNASASVRSPLLHGLWNSAAVALRKGTVSMRPLRPVLRRVKRVVDPVYRWMNGVQSAPADKPQVIWDDALRSAVRDYYADDVRALRGIVGREVPWPSAQSVR